MRLVDAPDDLILLVARASGTPLAPTGCVMLAMTNTAVFAALNAYIEHLKTLHAKALTLCQGKAGNIRNTMRICRAPMGRRCSRTHDSLSAVLLT